ncbi:hypothetical protein NBRC110019_25540 [Neptunitalea chrysea]|uniref:CarboxypepD_reg-like domain-containing protein n=1 Tax=Neptunitalea chrysea TaxID=1647581 RepID=A0A9W6EWS7_9FLAO|nr:carboxypeptidase-like regulatory domain-containing protein [Neptunitalea chrysea]GLB53513.1 hypothetical protein NBRC110019_25540 [Neptunitalea chrysea]
MKTLSISKSMQICMAAILFVITVLYTNKAQAQTTTAEEHTIERTVKGIISGTDGPLKDVNVFLKGTITGTTTNGKGEFTFPTPLNTGDVLTFSYLGYTTKNVKIKKDTTFIALSLTEEYVEFVGAPNSNQPYKSKQQKSLEE